MPKRLTVSMDLGFYTIQTGSSKNNGTFSCLLATNTTVVTGKPWTGIYIASDHNVSNGLPKPVTIQRLLQQFVYNPGAFNTLIFLYFAGDAKATTAAVCSALDGIDWHPGAKKNQGTVVWVAAPSSITQAKIDAAPQLPYSWLPSGTLVANAPSQQPLLSLISGTSLFITGGGTVPFSASTDNGGLLLSGGGLGIARGTSGQGQQPVVAAIDQIEIPAGDTNNGCLVFSGNFAGTLAFPGTLPAPTSGLGLGFQFGLSVDPGASSTAPVSGPLSYPLLDRPDALKGWATNAVLSILNPLDVTQAYFALPPSSADPTAGVTSAYRTLLDRMIKLTPQSGGSSRFVFNAGYGGGLYLTPQGSFAMSIDGGSEPNQYGLGNQLRCGLSGVEYVHFTPGDLLTFYPGVPGQPGNAAGVSVRIDADLLMPANATLAFDTTSACQTAYAMVLPAQPSQQDTATYYSEPDQAPFFAKSQVSDDPKELGYYALSLATLPATAGAPNYSPFPLLPYAAFVPPTDQNQFGFHHEYVETFEYQLINPNRKALIEKMAGADAPQSHTGQDATDVTAITPEGYAAVFAGNLWQKLSIAQMGNESGSNQPSQPLAGAGPADGPPAEFATYIDISFDKGNATQIPRALQEAMLTNQQFLVITTGRNASTNTNSLGSFNNIVKMDDWPFMLDLSKNTTVGDYYNVIIFKSGNATIRQLARHPELWTRYEDFNDTSKDPDGRFLSNWLVDYLQQATDLYDNGQGVASLQNFVVLIDDLTWNGFLALRVSITTQSLPDAIEALLAGIDKSLFVAHHIGNQVNHVVPPANTGDDYSLNSAMFGLVHYIDPTLGAQVNDLPSYIANPQTFDFKVLTLEAVFEGAKLVNFSNKSLLTLNSLFGEAVQQADAAGNSGANTLTLIGSYVANNNPAYTFATAQTAISDFYVSSDALARVEITSAAMTVTEVPAIQTNVVGELQCSQPTAVTPPSGETAYLARFTLAGNLQTTADTAFDLLSYERLSFQSCGLDMYLVTGGADRSFAFDSSAVRLALVSNVAVDPAAPGDATARGNAGSNLVRLGSLMAQFPLQLSGFIAGCGGRLPTAMGYRALETTIPKSVTPASLDGSDNWYALSFDLNLGSMGAIGAIGGLAAELLLAWAPGGQGGSVSVLPALKIAGPGGVNLSFDLEGVVKFGAADVVLNNLPTPDGKSAQFVLMFESIAFSILSFSFPPKGSTNVYLFGEADAGVKSGDPIKPPTLGWFGGYAEQQPAKTA